MPAFQLVREPSLKHRGDALASLQVLQEFSPALVPHIVYVPFDPFECRLGILDSNSFILVNRVFFSGARHQHNLGVLRYPRNLIVNDSAVNQCQPVEVLPAAIQQPAHIVQQLEHGKPIKYGLILHGCNNIHLCTLEFTRYLEVILGYVSIDVHVDLLGVLLFAVNNGLVVVVCV